MGRVPPRTAWLRRVVLDTRPLRIGSFRRLWISTIMTSIGGGLTSVAVPVQIYELTESSALIGLAALIGLSPLVAGALLGGAIADVKDRRWLLVVTNSGIAATSVLLFVQAAAGLRSVPVLLILVALQSGCLGANMPARGASVPRLVPVHLLAAANALNGTVGKVGAITAPLLAGALIPVVGLSALYLFDSIALVITVWMVWKLPSLPPGKAAPRRVGIRRIVEGFGYLGKHQILRVAYLADGIAMVLGMSMVLVPQLSHETFGDPASGGFAMGLLYASPQIGAVVAGFFSGMMTRANRHGMMVTLAVCAWGFTMIGFGLARWLWLMVFFLVLSGAILFVLAVFRTAIVQTVTTDEMRGRMEGANVVIIAGGPRLADLAHGAAGAALGTTWAISGGGVLVIAAILATVAICPAFWRYEAPTSEPSNPSSPSPEQV